MKSKVIIIICAISFSTLAFSQDVIIFKNGNEKKVKVLEVSPTEIKYKNFDFLEGPLYSEQKSSIFMIKYQNGLKDVFGGESPIVTPATQPKAVVPVAQPTTVPVVEPVKVAVELEPEKATTKNETVANDEDEFIPEARRYGGPRVGITYVGPGAFRDLLYYEGKRNLYSQFGWQFEKRLFTTKTGISGVVEFVPMIGGIDMGKFIPSATALIGIRTFKGIEFGAGPNAAIYGVKNAKGYYVTTPSFGIVIAAGMSFKSDKVYFPVNLVFIPSVGKTANVTQADGTQKTVKYQTGMKFSLLVGFNYRKS